MSARQVVGHPEWLVATDELEAQLGAPDLRILDCTTRLVPDPKTTYRIENTRPDWLAAHIPGSDHVDLQGELSQSDTPLRFMLPSAERFAETMEQRGVGEGTRVVLYCDGPVMWATRVFWMLRAFGFENAAVLDGGFGKWRAEGRPVATDEPVHPTTRFVARPRPDLFANKAAVLSGVEGAGTCIVNALAREQHTGESPVHYGRPGRIAGSVSLPAMHMLERETGAFRPTDELRRLLDEAGALEAKSVITYCGGGIAASVTAFALGMLGHENVALYDASLSEWANDASLPMETG